GRRRSPVPGSDSPQRALTSRVPLAIGVISFVRPPDKEPPMKMTFAMTIPFVLLAAAPAVAAEAAKKTAPAKADATSLNTGDIKWADAPPDLPKGAEMAVLHGDPTKRAVFTLRLKLPSGYKIPPHWHTRDEQLTIVSGAFVLHVGDSMEAPATTLTA